MMNNWFQLSNLVSLHEMADSIKLNRYNRVRAITIEANMKDGLALGDALGFLENLVDEHLPAHAVIDYKGQSRDYKGAGASVLFVLVLGVVVVLSSACCPIRKLGSPTGDHVDRTPWRWLARYLGSI